MSLNRNIFVNYAGRAYSVGALYLFIPFYVSILGVEAYGIIAFYTILVTFTAVADAGLSVAFSREVARGAERPRLMSLLTTIEGCLLAATLVIALSVFFTAEWIAGHWLKPGGRIAVEEIATCVRLMAVSLPAQLLISLYSAGLYGGKSQSAVNALQAGYTTIRSGAVIAVLWWSPSVVSFFIWHLVTTVVFAIVFRAALLRAFGAQAWAFGRFSVRTLAPVLAFAGGMLTISMISMVNTQLDKIVVSKLFSIEQFGFYTLAGSLAQLPVAGTTPIAIALSPAITSLIASGATGRAGELYEDYSSVIAFLGSLGAFGLVFYAGDVLALWLAGASIPPEVTDVAVILVLGGLFLCLQLTPYYLGLAHGDNGVIARLVALTLIVSVPAVYLGATLYGLRGAAVPWLILNAVNFFVLSAVINGRHHVGGHRRWLLRFVGLPVIVAAVLMWSSYIAGKSLSLGTVGRCALAAFVGGVAAAWLLVSVQRRAGSPAGA